MVVGRSFPFTSGLVGTATRLLRRLRILVSGVTPDARPGWGALMERLSEVDGIIVEPLDRISRDPGQLLDVLRRLEAMGKVIISVSDNGGESIPED